ncbi:tetratricopeptide repeat protein [Alkalicoccus daliensis]|uniref:Tetratricopeptide repeat protein n=1 Tax=Alkalicoccus daliensis TaxID=745820 RepID=A0A1H0DVS5_9BACI|nr:hypothetical protein [Alkalicoccus daliensis]SDN74081.1 hypothetical protein SAMN04488053_10399 [Alkalicoccus daliensis]
MDKLEALVRKTYYKQVVEEPYQQFPVKHLGELIAETKEEEEPDLIADIRYAQGEVYYHHQDLEAAVFKWELVKGSLKSWAEKNIGDAYYDNGWMEKAKEKYLAVNTEESVLKSEVALQLLSIYAEEKNQAKVYEYLTEALNIDPDYPGVSELARTIYEDNKDWNKAVDLAVKEAERTEDLTWYRHLLRYVSAGYTNSFTPEYFEKPARDVVEKDQSLFQELMAAWTAAYRDTDNYLYWVGTMNSIFATIELSRHPDWETMAALHHDIYNDLTDARYLEEEMEPVMPELLRHWEMLSNGQSAVLAVAAQAAWEEVFPEKESVLMSPPGASSQDASLAVEEMLRLLESIVAWVETEDIDPEETTDKLRQELSGSAGLSSMLDQRDGLTFDRVKWLESIRTNELQAERIAENLSRAISNLLGLLLEQQKTVEFSLEDSIQFYEEMLSRFKGLRATLSDTRSEKQENILETYLKMKQMQKEQFESNVPSLIKATEDVLNDEEKSAKNLHEELNVAMNTRLRAYVDEQLFPIFRKSLQQWLRNTEAELQVTQDYLNEMNESLNGMIGEEKLHLQLDFELIHDWKRDLTRMINRTELPEENIMSRLEPKQLLLRNVGKYFGDMQQSKSFLLQQYKRYLENDDFQDVAETLSYKLFFEFDLFERAIRADVDTAFADIIEHIEAVMAEYEEQLQLTKEELAKLQAHPEYFYDPLKIFDMRHKQCERLLGDDKQAKLS